MSALFQIRRIRFLLNAITEIKQRKHTSILNASNGILHRNGATLLPLSADFLLSLLSPFDTNRKCR